MKKQFLTLLALLLTVVVSAEPVEIDGIYYELVSKAKKAEVKSNPNGKYTGSVIIPASITYGGTEYSVTSIGESAFWGCSSLTSVHISDIAEWCKISFVNNNSNPLNYAHHLYLGGGEITDLIIPNSVTSIGGYAFLGCSSLTTITIGSGVKNIGSQAFAYCKELTDVYCLAESMPTASTNIFQDSYIEYATLHVSTASIEAYKENEPWKNFKSIVSLTGEDIPVTPDPEKCAIPTITFFDRKLKFNCVTEGVEYVYEIKDADIKKGCDSEVQLSATYEISVYATKQGFDNSDIATATLVWGSATFTETTGQATAAPAINAESPLLIQSQGGVLTIQGADDGTKIGVYNINGTLVGEGISRNGCTTVNTNLQPGSMAIIKIGDRSVKVTMK